MEDEEKSEHLNELLSFFLLHLLNFVNCIIISNICCNILKNIFILLNESKSSPAFSCNLFVITSSSLG